MTQKRLELKNEIKSLAQQIKDARKGYKNKEHRSDAYSKVALAFKEVTKNEIGMMSNSPERKQLWENYRALRKQLLPWEDLPRLCSEFRHKHIVASLLRGKTRQEIERTVRDANNPSEEWINKLIEEYKNEVPFSIILLNQNNKEATFQ